MHVVEFKRNIRIIFQKGLHDFTITNYNDSLCLKSHNLYFVDEFILVSESVSGLSVTDQLVKNGVDITFSQLVHVCYCCYHLVLFYCVNILEMLS